jgi:hypothetical protein
MRPAAALAVVSCLILAGCGGGEKEPAAVEGPGSGATLEELWQAPGDHVAVVPGTENHEPGAVRVSFLVLDAEGGVVTSPTARVRVATGLEAEPFLETTAKIERIGVPGGAEADASHIYVARFRLPKAGKYWFLAEPEGGSKDVRALGDVIVREKDRAPDIGDTAPPSKTPTIASTGGDFSKLTTRTPPDETLLEHSVAESLAAKVPFVVTFATPKYCASRTCGPTVDVVEEVQRRLEASGVRFIHVEVYEDNDPAKGFNRWLGEWKLETEPWTFLVGRDGRIVERYEGVVSVRELEEAVLEKLASD